MAAKTTTGGMVAIKGGEFLMGSNDFYPEELPARRVRVESFAIDCVRSQMRSFQDSWMRRAT